MSQDVRDIISRMLVVDDPRNEGTINRMANRINKLGDVAVKSESRIAQLMRTANQNYSADTSRAMLVKGLDTGETPSSGSKGRGVGKQQIGRGLSMAGQVAGQVGAGEAGQAMSMFGMSIAQAGAAGGVAAAVMIGLKLALNEVNKAAEEARRITELQTTAIMAEINAKGQTTEEIKKQIAAQEEIYRNAAEAVQRIKDESLADAEATRTGITGALKDAGDFLGLYADGINDANKDIEEQTTLMEDAEGRLIGMNEALGSTETAAADAAEALKEFNEQMAEDLLDAASDASEAIKDQTDAMERTKEANAERLKAIAAEQKALQAELKILQSSGITNEKVAAKIKGLQEALSDLGVEAGTISKVMKTQSAATEEVDRAVAHFVGSVKNGIPLFFANIAAQKKAQAEQKKNAVEFANKIADIEYKAAVDREKIAIDANRDQARLLREAKQVFNQDFYQDFLGEFQRRSELAFNLRETQINTGQAFEDVNRGSFQEQQKLRGEMGAQPLINNNTFVFPQADQSSVLTTLNRLGITNQ